MSNTEGLAAISMGIMGKHGVTVDAVRAVDHELPVGVWPEMTEHGCHSTPRLRPADAGWSGEAGPGPSYLDPGSGGPENDSPTATPRS